MPIPESKLALKLEVKNLACKRGSKSLFRNLSFNLHAGECLLIKGHNGSGKSTLLKMLAGFSTPQKGSIHWPCQTRPLSLSYLGHRDGLRKWLTPYENVMSYLKMSDVKPNAERIELVLRELEISEFAQLPCAHLSAGQNRKISLAAIVLAQKKIWILDEPFSALDQKGVEILKQWMYQQLQNKGIIMISSHFFKLDFNHHVIELGS